MRKLLFFIFFSFIFGDIIAQPAFLDLSGEWNFQLDRHNQGINQKWFNQELKEKVRLPGSLIEQQIGDEITLETAWTGSIYDSSYYFHPRLEKYRQPGDIKIPFWLTPLKYYVGPAWYQKTFTLSASDLSNRLVLHLEQPHTESVVWVNGQEIGLQNSMVAPHRYDISQAVKTGKNMITIRIDNRIKDINVGQDSHSLTDHTQGNWNGIVGKIGLEQGSKVYVDDIQIYPNIHKKEAQVKLTLYSPQAKQITIKYVAESFNSKHIHRTAVQHKVLKVKGKQDAVTLHLSMGDDMLLWDEFEPNLYKAIFQVYEGNKLLDTKEITFGMREFKAIDRDFYINGRKVFLRGTCDNAVFPLTGYPPMDEASWVKVFAKVKSYGLNHVRFHSYCPPEAAFKAADKLGLYLQPEGPSWANHGSSLGQGKPIDQFIYDETNRMAKYYGNYASFCMMAYGNEPRGNQVPYLTKFVDYWKAKDSRRLYTGASVGGSWPVIPNNEFMVRAGARGLDWGRRPESEGDYSEKIAQFSVPFVAHELGQYCVFPNFEEIKKYTGAYRAKNFELFQEDLQDQGMADQAKDFLYASGKLQVLAYKHEIEKALRTPNYSGFQLLSLNDYPGQGTALVGLLDAFWEEKGYVDAKEFTRFCDTTVLLIQTPKFVYTNNESLVFKVDVAHYGRQNLQGRRITWRLVNTDRNVYRQGDISTSAIVIGLNQDLATVEIPLDGIEYAREMKLELLIRGTSVSNDWDFYIYPSILPDLSDAIYYSTEITDTVRQVLNDGGKVFLNLAGKITQGKEVIQHFQPVFWNTSWFKMRPPHTLGFVTDRNHLGFASFPTQNYSTIQWWDIVNRAQVMHLEDFPKDFRPLVQPIDTWFLNRRLGLIFEANVGKGKIIVSSADISWQDKRAVNRQLYYSLVNYMESSSFQPKHDLNLEVIEGLTTKVSKFTFDNYTTSSPDELKPNLNEFIQQ